MRNKYIDLAINKLGIAFDFDLAVYQILLVYLAYVSLLSLWKHKMVSTCICKERFRQDFSFI